MYDDKQWTQAACVMMNAHHVNNAHVNDASMMHTSSMCRDVPPGFMQQHVPAQQHQSPPA